MREDYEYVNVIAVTRSRLGYHCIITYHNESDPLGAVSAVLCADQPVGGRIRTCLGANCQLNAAWASPAGELWAVDDHGDVYSTADVSFDRRPYRHLRFNSGHFDIDWKVSEIFPGQLNGVWGSSDGDVWVTSFNGPALRWDGQDWQRHELPPAPNAIDGSAPDDVYVVGYQSNIHHWDGRRWRKVAVPPGISPTDVFTDVRAVDRDAVYVAGRSGCLLVGNSRDGFEDVGSGHYSWYGVGTLKGRVFLAGGQRGIFELVDGRFVCLKDKGHPVGVFELPGAIGFVPAEQRPNPWFVYYEPGADQEWLRANT